MENQGSMNEAVQAQFGEDSSEGSIEAAMAEKQTEEASKPVEAKEDIDFSKKFAALSRKEKEIRSRESEYEKKSRELQERLDALEAEKNTVPAKEPELPLEYRLRKNPLETLKELGFDYDTLTELALNDGKLTQDMQLKLMREELENGYKSKFEELEKRLLDKEKSEEESKYNKVITDFKNEINELVMGDSEAYELIQANDASDLVYDIIEEHYNETGRVLDLKEAADAVEDYLENEAKRLLSLKKLSKHAVAKESEKPVEPVIASPTLSNDHSAMSQNGAERKLTPEESLIAASKLLKWNS